MVCKLFVMTCPTSRNLLDNIYTVFLQYLCKKFGVQGSNLWIPQTEPAGPVLQGPVQGSAVCLNKTISPVQGSGKVSFELDQTGPLHHYAVQYRQTAVCSHYHAVVSLDFISTALLWYCPHPYSTVCCTAVAVYGTVVSPNPYSTCTRGELVL